MTLIKSLRQLNFRRPKKKARANVFLIYIFVLHGVNRDLRISAEPVGKPLSDGSRCLNATKSQPLSRGESGDFFSSKRSVIVLIFQEQVGSLIFLIRDSDFFATMVSSTPYPSSFCSTRAGLSIKEAILL